MASTENDLPVQTHTILRRKHFVDFARCCRYTSSDTWEPLLACTSNVTQAATQKILKGLVTDGAPSLGVGIITFASSNIWNYSAYSFSLMAGYTIHQGYALHLVTNNSYDHYDERWTKVKILEEALDPNSSAGWAAQLDYLVWMDADAVVLDWGLRIEALAARYPQAHLLVSAEHAGSTTMMNSGVIIVRNSLWTRQVLSLWWTFADRRLHSDQEQFDLLYQHFKHSQDWQLQRRIVILPPDAINSDPPAMANQKPHNQFLHLMGEHTAYRVKVFQSGLQEVCRHLELPASQRMASPLPLQLTMTRENLLRWSLDVYSTEATELFHAYQMKATEGKNGLLESRKLSNAVHHYAYSLILHDRENHLDHSNTLRIQLFDLLRANMAKRRALLTAQLTQQVSVLSDDGNHDRRSQQIHHVDADWPEHLKIIAEAGQHLLSIGDIHHRRRIAQQVMHLLQEILSICHRGQRNAVMQLVAYLTLESGTIELSDSNHSLALAFFEEGLRISRELAVHVGEHILVTPLSYTANLLALLERYEEAVPLYQQALTLSERHVGDSHRSRATLLVNYATALRRAGRSEEAQAAAKQAMQIIHLQAGWSQSEFDDLKERIRWAL